MSRTYRKRLLPYTEWIYKDFYRIIVKNTHTLDEKIEDKYISRQRYKYYTQSGYRNTYSFPKEYRKHTNKLRKLHDSRELYKELNFIEYEGLYSKWNCKDSDPAWYW